MMIIAIWLIRVPKANEVVGAAETVALLTQRRGELLGVDRNYPFVGL
jgi:hypothetical protein